MADKNGKFENEDLPVILAAVKQAHEAGAAGTVTVAFSENGGVLSVIQETKKRLK